MSWNYQFPNNRLFGSTVRSDRIITTFWAQIFIKKWSFFMFWRYFDIFSFNVCPVTLKNISKGVTNTEKNRLLSKPTKMPKWFCRFEKVSKSVELSKETKIQIYRTLKGSSLGYTLGTFFTKTFLSFPQNLKWFRRRKAKPNSFALELTGFIQCLKVSYLTSET